MRYYIFLAIVSFVSISTIKNPFVGLVSYTLINIVRPEMFFWGGRTGSKAFIIFFGLTLFVTLLHYFKLQKENFTDKPICIEIVLWTFIYLAFLILMPMSHYNIGASYKYIHEIGKNALFGMLVFINLFTFKRVYRYQLLIVIAFTFLGIWGIEQHMLGNVRLEGLGGKSWGDSNGVAAMFVLFFPVALSFINVSNAKLVRYFAIFATLVIVLLVFYTNSRGGFLGMSAAAFFVWMKWKNKIRIALLFFLMIMLIVPFIEQKYFDRLSTISAVTNEDAIDSSASSRLIFWKSAILVFKDHPFLGVGFGAFPEAKLAYRDQFSYLDQRFLDNYFRPVRPYVTHSTYLQMLSEGGLLIMIPFLWIIIGTFWKNRKIRKIVPIGDGNRLIYQLLGGIEAGIFGYCVCIIFINSILLPLFPVQIIVSAKLRNILYAEHNNKLGS